MKGAFGIPRGFFSSENTALIFGGIAEEKRAPFRTSGKRRCPVGDLNTKII